MRKGIYENVVNKKLNEQIAENREKISVHCEELKDNTNNILTAYMGTVLSKVLNGCADVNKQVEVVNSLIKQISKSVQDDDFNSYLIEDPKLLKVIEDNETTDGMKKKEKSSYYKSLHPISSITTSTLFTGSTNEPTVYSELIREIKTADNVDLLVSFIKFSGLRLLLDALKDLTINRNKKLRVITTSYMSASDYKAIEVLAELPNTEVKISYDTQRTRLHAKAYYFHRDTGFSTAYIGSSNMSKAALTEGTEWNLKLSEYTSPDIITKYCVTFDTYWNSMEFQTFNPDNSHDVIKLKKSLSSKNDNNALMPIFDIRPYAYQQEILDRLEVERDIHLSKKNLVVAATGTGKTVIAAFDFKRYYTENKDCRLLFLAHRKEILEQSLSTFRGVLKDQNFGELWVSDYKPTEFNHTFASIQTLNVNKKYLQFSKEYFDYIVLDETHHSKATSYERILNYFEADILLGLTATPERMDGKNILEFFNNRVAYEIRLQEAIDRSLLCPFHYFGVTDTVDLSDVKWIRGKYDFDELTNVYTGNHKRAQLVIDAIRRYTTDIEDIKALGFCVSRDHARFMSAVFNKAGLKSIYLDGLSDINTRNSAKRRLSSGEIRFIFVVDIYNEGIDIPDVNTILFLRPTESATVFIQQLGRGLRISDKKEVLTVLDFVGQANNQYNFTSKFRGLLGRTNNSIKQEMEMDFPSLPKGCHIHLEKIAKEYVFKNLEYFTANKNTLKRLLRNYKYESNRELNLNNFIKHYDLELNQIYKANSFYGLCKEEGLIAEYKAQNENEINSGFGRLMFLDSKLAIDILIGLLNKDYVKMSSLSEDEYKVLLMYYYTMFNKSPEGKLERKINSFIESNPTIIKESIELLTFNKNRIIYNEKKVNLGFSCPLELHARYTSDQILVAVDEHTNLKKKSFREGVLYSKKHNTDLLFITLNKSENHYSPTTQYEDYAINNKLFHWQSQNKTSDTSSVGLRYVNQKHTKHNVLLFVREDRQENKLTAPYYYLGKANYISHTGNKPMSIVWELEEEMPMTLLKKSNRMSDIV